MILVTVDVGDIRSVLDDHAVHVFAALGHEDYGVDVRRCRVGTSYTHLGKSCFGLLILGEGIGGNEDIS